MKEQILELLKSGHSYRQIMEIVGCSIGTISYHAKANGLSKGPRDKYNWQEIQKYYDLGFNIEDCKAKYGFTSMAWKRAVAKKKIIPRPFRLYKHEELFTDNSIISRGVVRDYVLKDKLIPYLCALCGIDTWQAKALSLHLDHINGKKTDHRLENLRFLCPNCHSQTETYGSKNIGRCS